MFKRQPCDVVACVMVIFALLASTRAISAESGVLEKARSEGKVTWYALSGTRQGLKDVLPTWDKLYPGITLEIVEASGPDSLERVKAEARAGRPVGDVVAAGDPEDLVAAGLYQPLNPALVPNLAMVPPRIQKLGDPEKRFVPYGVYLYGMLVNTHVMAEGQQPKRWADLLDPKYRGKIAMYDPRRIGGGSLFITYATDALGPDFLKSLFKQDIRVYGQFAEVDTAVIQGARAIAVPGRSRTPHLLAGAPVKFLVPEEGIFFTAVSVGVVTNAPHPTAANLLVDFLLSPEVQQVYAKLGDVPVVSGVPSEFDLEKVPLLGRLGKGEPPISDLTKLLEQAKSLVGQ